LGRLALDPEGHSDRLGGSGLESEAGVEAVGLSVGDQAEIGFGRELGPQSPTARAIATAWPSNSAITAAKLLGRPADAASALLGLSPAETRSRR
jgi:hypothetical protein